MDIMSGMSAVSTALQITKDLRDLDVSLSKAEMKAKFAELYNSLADAKIALSDAKLTLNSKEGEISELKLKITALMSGDMCPLCSSGRMKIIASVPHPIFGVHGHMQRTLKCQNVDCGHSENRKYNPNGD